MGIQTKDIGAVATKWSQRAQAAGADYTAGVKAPRRDWATETSAAATAYEQGVTQAVGQQRFQKGVQAAGTGKWQNNAVNKGSTRYPQGVSVASPTYQTNFGPYLDTIKGVTLPPRSPRGSPNNIQRVQAIADALHRKKVGG